MFKANGNGVIPLKFSLSSGLGPVVFQSIGSDGYYGYSTGTNYSDDSSALNFSPTSLTGNQINNLTANYSFTTGNCHGGALRWSIGTTAGTVFVYYGATPNFVDCTTNSQSGVNLATLTDSRWDTSQIVGGTFYDNYAHAMYLIGASQVQFVALVLDAGWAGDQIVTLTSATVNDNTWTPAPSGTLAPTCALPPATIKITKTSGSDAGSVDEVTSIQPSDNNSQFRIVSCNYIYNLATSSLSGAGVYQVQVVINNVTATGSATFGLK